MVLISDNLQLHLREQRGTIKQLLKVMLQYISFNKYCMVRYANSSTDGVKSGSRAHVAPYTQSGLAKSL